MNGYFVNLKFINFSKDSKGYIVFAYIAFGFVACCSKGSGGE